MAKQTALFLTWKYRFQGTNFANSDGTNQKTIATYGTDINGSANDSNIVALTVTSNDNTQNNWLQLALTDGLNIYNWLAIEIPQVASGNYVSTVDCLATQGNGVISDTASNFYFKLASGTYILGNLITAVASGKQVSIIAIAEDF